MIPLEKCSNLQILNLSDNQIKKIENLHLNKNLRYLYLFRNQIQVIENLKNQ